MAQALRHPNLISLAAGFVDNATLPCAATAACLETICGDDKRMRAALQYDAAAGNLELRETIAEWSNQTTDQQTADNVILTAGSNQMLHLLAEALFNPGDIVLTASPTYFVFLGTLRGVGARAMGIAADEDGILIDDLRERMAEIAATGQAEKLKAIYLVTDFDNPAGSTLSVQRRTELLELVRQWRSEHGPLVVISDNAYTLLRYEGTPLPALTQLDPTSREFVIDLGTFSKSFSPGVRVGWGTVPNSMVPMLLDMKSNIDFGSPHFSQVLILEAIRSGEFDRHLEKIRAAYRLKMHAMLDALSESFDDQLGVRWQTPRGGLYVWLTLPDAMDASESGELWQRAVDNGVLYVPGHYCFPSEGQPVQRNTARLSFGVQDEAAIRHGISQLAAAVKSLV